MEANHPTLPPLHPGVGCSYLQGDPEVSSFERSPRQELWMWAAGRSALLASSPGISNGDGKCLYQIGPLLGTPKKPEPGITVQKARVWKQSHVSPESNFSSEG